MLRVLMSNLAGLCLSTRPQETSLALRKPPDAGRRQAELTRHHGAAHDGTALACKAKGHRLDALILHRVDGLMSRVAGEWGQKGMVGLGCSRAGGWVASTDAAGGPSWACAGRVAAMHSTLVCNPRHTAHRQPPRPTSQHLSRQVGQPPIPTLVSGFISSTRMVGEIMVGSEGPYTSASKMPTWQAGEAVEAVF